MDLYTSLVRLKQELNDGSLPPMTPITDPRALAIINPAFTIGLGAFAEDAERGLRCPLRGCGRWFHRLSTHIARAHPETSVRDVREKLSIPQSASLVSQQERALARQRAVDSLSLERLGSVRALNARTHRLGTQVRKAAMFTVGAKNLRNACPAQLSHKIIDLHNKVGRTPSGREANALYGEGFTTAVIAVYGTWNNAIAQCGLEIRKKSLKYSTHDVIVALDAYYQAHGTLPSMCVARRRRTAPVLPSIGAVLNAFGVSSWPEAMRRSAAMLDIHGGRYGLPVRAEPQAGAA